MVAKPFNDYSQMFKGIPEPKAADLVTKPKKDEGENNDGENGNDENGNGENNNEETKE